MFARSNESRGWSRHFDLQLSSAASCVSSSSRTCSQRANLSYPVDPIRPSVVAEPQTTQQTRHSNGQRSLRQAEAARRVTSRLKPGWFQNPQSPFVCAKARLRAPIGTPALVASS
jgi:hypothetical protein